MRQFIIPYLAFKNSIEAANYYKDIFDGTIEEIMTGKDVPNTSKEDANRIFHLELKIQDHYIYMYDSEINSNGKMTLLLDYKDLDLMQKAFEKIKVGNTVIQELKDTFWGAKYAVVEDKYGMRWEFHFMKPKE